jgi:hypothetical protein
MLWSVILAFLLAVVVHAILRRMSSVGVVPLFVIVGTVVAAGFAAWWFTTFFAVAEFFALLLVYAVFCELYLFFVTLSLASISANILVALLDRRMSTSELDLQYRSQEMIDARLDRIVGAGLAVKIGDDHLVLTPKGTRLIGWLDLVRRFFHVQSIREAAGQ